MNTAPGRLRLQSLTAADLSWVAQLSGHDDCAAALGFAGRASPAAEPAARLEAARAWLEVAHRERGEGRRHLLGVSDGRVLGALVALEKIGAGEARLLVVVDPALRRQGVGRFAVEQILLYAFQSLRLDRVQVRLASPAPTAFFARLGFVAAEKSPAASGDASATALQLTRTGWQEDRNAPALAALHGGLRTVLQQELAAGNEIVETGRGWPDADSVFVKLKRAFTVPRDALPAGVSYHALNDPHWWMEEFTSAQPRHILAR